MIAVVARDNVEAVSAAAEQDGVATWIIGEIVRGRTTVRFAER
jgi:hypothetical protein